MRKNLKFVSAGLSLLACASCSTQPHVITQPVKSDENIIISSSAAVTSGLLRDSSDIKHYCASVAADSTFNETAREGASISLFNIGRSAPEKESVSAGVEETEMVGRTPALLVSREILYRICELTGNRSFTNNEVLKLYEKTIDAIVQIASKETANTSISIEARTGADRNEKVSMESVTDLATAIGTGSPQQSDAGAAVASNNSSYQPKIDSTPSNSTGYSPSSSTGYTPGIPSD